eukprot:3874325-Amphidinium_carterae.1
MDRVTCGTAFGQHLCGFAPKWTDRLRNGQQLSPTSFAPGTKVFKARKRETCSDKSVRISSHLSRALLCALRAYGSRQSQMWVSQLRQKHRQTLNNAVAAATAVLEYVVLSEGYCAL